MAMKKFTVGVGKRPIESGPNGDVVLTDVCREVEAEHVTIEVSGAISFWRTIIKGQSSALVVAFAPGQWTTIDYVSQED